MKKALLLIDVQKHFVRKQHGPSIDYINKLIVEYSRKNLPIFNLVYDDPFGRTIVEGVKKKLEKARGVWHFSKGQDDGGREAKAILALRGIDPGKAKIHTCGYNTDACVMDTSVSLHKAGHKIVIHSAGTGSWNKASHNSGLRRMKKLGIEIVDEDNSIG